FLRLRLGRGEKPGPQASGREHGFSDGRTHARIVSDGVGSANSAISRVRMSLPMLDSTFVRNNIEAVRAGLRSRGLDPDKSLEELATLDSVRRRVIPEIEGLKRQQNTSGDEVARAKRQGQDTTAIQDANRVRAQQIKQLG